MREYTVNDDAQVWDGIAAEIKVEPRYTDEVAIEARWLSDEGGPVVAFLSNDQARELALKILAAVLTNEEWI